MEKKYMMLRWIIVELANGILQIVIGKIFFVDLQKLLNLFYEGNEYK